MPSQGTIGDRVRGLRLNRRMSQAQLAGPDLSDSYVSLIESGKRTPTPVVARLLAERLGCTTEFLLHGIEPRQRIDTELGLRHAELELQHGDPAVAAERFTEIVKAADEENAMLTAHARFGRARALEAQGRLGQAVEAFERLRREASAHPERLADLPLTVALSRCYQRAGDRLRARDLAAHALEQALKLSITQGEIAIDLAAAIVEARGELDEGSAAPAFVARVLDDNGVPDVVDRSGEIRTLWQASAAAAAGDDSALAVRLADDAITAGRSTRLALQLARTAMHWATLATTPVDEAEHLAREATRAFAATPDTTREHGEALIAHGRVRLRVADPARAGELASAALDLAHAAPHTVPAEAHLVLATVALDLGGDAAKHLNAARGLLETLDRPAFGSDRQAARCWRELGDLYGRVGDQGHQTAAYRKALEAAGVRSALAGLTVDASVSR
ncbi:transcriptional regulator with XRE-family HTH domain [Nonomuraea muscovyensis]|uniref:Transcriptional regulator with XRE-family HTH domain n=1 Tax=Nonomuraea muscovyensis TaxID=1124761 RepID=A0A7X0C045_9ACTN|nr:helix-turn-helix transcriptional regulator [Nonomuraea muscovyensis]MBB6346015.1 transcriptional regulator with XRE-family HTH domain [Nonomuraea muscovyensis]